MSGKRPHPHGEQSPAKKAKINLAESSSPRRSRKDEERSSGESSTPSVFSTYSAAQTARTSPSPLLLASKMATNPAADPTAFEGYYYGLPGCPKLLACSNPELWMAPSFEVTANSSPRTKTVFVVTHHPLREKLNVGLRDTIIGILATMNRHKWISVDYLRIGYEKGVV